MKIVLVEDDRALGLYEPKLIETLLSDTEIIVRTQIEPEMLDASWWADKAIAFIDLMLPHISGIELLRFLTRECPWVACVVTTAIYEIPAEAIELADATLGKPFSPAQMQDAIARAQRKHTS